MVYNPPSLNVYLIFSQIGAQSRVDGLLVTPCIKFLKIFVIIALLVIGALMLINKIGAQFGTKRVLFPLNF